MTPPQIRRATRDDLSDITSCAEAAYAQYVEAIGKKPAPMVADFAGQIARDQVWLAATPEGFQGYIVFYPSDGAMFLENVAVHPKYAGQGIGRALIAFCEDQARTGGFLVVRLYTNEKMTANLTLYPRLGYAETERRREEGFNRVYFEKRLS